MPRPWSWPTADRWPRPSRCCLGVPAERNPFSFYNGSISRLAWDTEVKLQTFNQLDHLHGLMGGSGDL